MADLVRALTGAVGQATGRAWRALAGEGGGSATGSISVAADLDVALLVSAAALRRLGARITRYEMADGLVEARHAATDTLVRISASAESEPGRPPALAGITTLRLAGRGRQARALLRRFRTELARPTVDAAEPR